MRPCMRSSWLRYRVELYWGVHWRALRNLFELIIQTLVNESATCCEEPKSLNILDDEELHKVADT